jgi:hypothetical protein
MKGESIPFGGGSRQNSWRDSSKLRAYSEHSSGSNDDVEHFSIIHVEREVTEFSHLTTIVIFDIHSKERSSSQGIGRVKGGVGLSPCDAGGLKTGGNENQNRRKRHSYVAEPEHAYAIIGQARFVAIGV